MKAGLFVGHEEQIEVVVTEEMLASFGGKVLHPVLSTVSMIYYMEWAGRKVIEPFLEVHEEGIGASINIRHLAPAPLGKEVLFKATATHVNADKVVCFVSAEHNQAVVGEGEFVQVILRRERIEESILQMSK